MQEDERCAVLSVMQWVKKCKCRRWIDGLEPQKDERTNSRDSKHLGTCFFGLYVSLLAAGFSFSAPCFFSLSSLALRDPVPRHCSVHLTSDRLPVRASLAPVSISSIKAPLLFFMRLRHSQVLCSGLWVQSISLS